MRTIILLCFLVASIGASEEARADIGKQKCKDPAHFVFNPSSGCIKRPPVRLKTPAESYVNALDALDNDPKRSASLFDAACNAKYAPACLQLGRLYQTGRGRAVQKDAKKALALYERGCELGDGAACQKRGDEARKEGVQHEARAWFVKGCDRDDGNACAYLALMLDGGHGGDKNVADAKLKYDKAHKLMEALCPGNGLACFLRGYFLENGYGIKADSGKALDAYRRGCNDSFGDACWKVAKIIDRTKGDPKEAVAMYERACELENADGCSQAAGRLSDEDPKATHPVELAERGCNLDTKEWRARPDVPARSWQHAA
ncbi:MAG: tetratricopeptide repeat protein [Proteobacteria bacterium]|nr:tetratricopeptide repeat protein [Pseudomonadota bacterium]